MENPKPEHLTKAGLKARGWTDAAIRRFLPEPDAQKPNPRYRSAPPMLLWDLEKVEAIETSPEWLEWKAKSSVRSERALKVVDTRRQQLLEEIKRHPVRLKIMPPEKLLRNACWLYNNRQQEMSESASMPNESTLASPSSDKGFLDRITVNYLRHQCSDYEKSLESTIGKVGVNPAYGVIRNRVLQAIAEAYPELQTECERQKSVENDASTG